jgi:hypothetical protein
MTNVILIILAIELLFILRYMYLYKKFEELRGTGRVPEIVSTNHRKQFAMIMIIVIPIIAAVAINNLYYSGFDY